MSKITGENMAELRGSKGSDDSYMHVQNDVRERDPYEKLGYAIIYSQVEDLDKGLKKCVKEGVHPSQNWLVMRAYSFFHRPWFSELCLDTLDGAWVWDVLMKNWETYGTVINQEVKDAKK